MSRPRHYQNNFVARQPVFTHKGRLWGYELLFRSNAKQNSARITCPEEASAHVMIEGISMALPHATDNLKALINVPQAMLDSNMLEYLPQKKCVLEILEDVNPTPEVLMTLENLHNAGYMLALDDYTGQEHLAPMLPLMDIIKVDFLEVSSEERAPLTRSLLGTNPILLAEKVESHEDMRQAQELGYTYMQGYYFQKPEIIRGRKVTPTLAARVHALWLLSNPELERRDLMEFFTRSPQLSYRLLKFANSAAFASVRSITTLSDACAILGTQRLRQWITAVLLADKQYQHCKQELIFMGTVRACFLQNISNKLTLPYGEQLFMLGLFSLLDALYDMPFEDLLKSIPVDAYFKEALVCRQGDMGQWLHLSEHLERGQFDKATEVLHDLGVQAVGTVMEAYQEAFLWAKDAVF